MAEPMRAILRRQSCWAGGQCSVQRPVMYVAGLRVWACGGCVGGGVGQSGAGRLGRAHRALRLPTLG